MIKVLRIPSSQITIIKFSNENPKISSHILTVDYKLELVRSSNKVQSGKKGGRAYFKMNSSFFFKNRVYRP